MIFLAPVWLGVGVAGALGVLALHFIARMRPAPMMLPTARFVPDLPARAASRAPRPTDPLLLILRAAAALLLGLAFAGPIATPSRVPLARVVLLDRSAAVADPAAAAALAVGQLRQGDVLVAFDTTAEAIDWAEGATIPDVRQAPGDLAAALLVGVEKAREVAPRADSVALVLISAVDATAWSAAVMPVRAEWPGAIRVERVAVAAIDSMDMRIAVRGERDDPLRATVELLGSLSPDARVRIVRGPATAADSAWVRDSSGALVVWPRQVASDSAGEAGAVIAGDVVAVAPWTRGVVPEGRVAARWVDGGAAATEESLGSGCVRHVGVGIPEAGDVALAASTQRLVGRLAAPCVAAPAAGTVPDSLVRRLAGSGGAVAGVRLVRAGPTVSAATPWLIAAAIGLLLIEWLARARMARR